MSKQKRPRLSHREYELVKRSREIGIGVAERALEEPEKDIDTRVEIDKIERRYRAKLLDSKRKYRRLLDEHQESEARYDNLLAVSEPIYPKAIPVTSREGGEEACAILMLSDWHIEERVDKRTVHGANEFNPDIARRRVTRCFQSVMKLIEKERQAIRIDHLMIHLGGDFISGHIHEELTEDNYLSPIEATLLAKELIISGLDFISTHGNLRDIQVFCSHGNHGRTTPRIRISSGYKNSFEWGMYHDLARYYESNSSIQFHIPHSDVNYGEIFGYTFRFVHGNEFNYRGGIGGLTVPLVKYLHRANEQKHANYTLMGHWHQRIPLIHGCAVNGSLIGYNAYGQKIGARPEPPQQSFLISQRGRGITGAWPVFVE